MASDLPQLSGDRLFLTDGGLETTLIFHEGIDLPSFAAFDLLKDEAGREALRRYFRPYLETARERGAGFILDTATWRYNALMGECARRISSGSSPIQKLSPRYGVITNWQILNRKISNKIGAKCSRDQR